MKEYDKKYAKINEEERRALEQEWYECVVRDYRKEMVESDFYKYEVIIQNIKFITYMTEDELKLSAGFAVDLLEELKNINNNGINRKVYEQIMRETEITSYVMIQGEEYSSPPVIFPLRIHYLSLTIASLHTTSD